MELHYLTATAMVAALRRGEVSSRELLEAHLARIAEVNPVVNAFVTLTGERAQSEAAAADERLARSEPLGPLDGLPFGYKDTQVTAGIRTTWGSPIYADHVPETDELLVERLRASGAVTVGKTNVPEFAAGSHTFNTVFGATFNPYDLSRSAGGSSGGAAAAVASGMVPLASGSDMGGSLRNPASFCNVVGLRPTSGRIPDWPSILPLSPLSVSGPIARTVADVALLLSVMAGPDPRSPVSLDEPGAGFAEIAADGLAGLRVAWAPDLGGRYPVDEDVAKTLVSQLPVLTDLGATVEEAAPDLREAKRVFEILRAFAFAAKYGPLLAEHRDVIKRTVVENTEAGLRLTAEEMIWAAKAHGRLYETTRTFFGEYDLIALPVSQVPPFPVGIEYPTEIAGEVQASYIDWMRSCTLISATGCPAISVPAGFTSAGLPIGLQLVAPHRAEKKLLAAAHAFEQATRFGEVRPSFSGASETA